MEEEDEGQDGEKTLIYVLLVVTVLGAVLTLRKVYQRWRVASSQQVMRCDSTDRAVPNRWAPVQLGSPRGTQLQVADSTGGQVRKADSVSIQVSNPASRASSTGQNGPQGASVV